jgi:hypothetical protein
MQGNCAGAPPSAASLDLSCAPLLPLLPYQCLIIADMDLLWTDFQLWLDGLYVRYRCTTRADSFYNFIAVSGQLWMTAVTLQGDGNGVPDCASCGIRTDRHSYAEGMSPCPTHPHVWCLPLCHIGSCAVCLVILCSVTDSMLDPRVPPAPLTTGTTLGHHALQA